MDAPHSMEGLNEISGVMNPYMKSLEGYTKFKEKDITFFVNDHK